MSVPVRFLAPPLGLGSEVAYVLDAVEGATGLFTLAPERIGAGAPERLFLLDAGSCLRHYDPVISSEQQRMLGLSDPAEAWVLVVANPDVDGTTVNLLAPIVVNSTTSLCAQLILEGQEWPLRAPLEDFAAA